MFAQAGELRAEMLSQAVAKLTHAATIDGCGTPLSAWRVEITEGRVSGNSSVPGARPKNLEFVELEAAQLPRSLEDTTLSVINGNYALEADLNQDGRRDLLLVVQNERGAPVRSTTILPRASTFR